MANSGLTTKVITKRGEEAMYSTEEFWAKFSYSVIGDDKAKPDKLIEARHNQDITDEKALKVEICKGVLLEALGDVASAEFQLKKPKTKIYRNRN